MARIAVLITCFNRREVTLECLRLLLQDPIASPSNVFLVDDGSTDGTGEAVRREFPGIVIIRGGGSLFWNGGMARAFERALYEGFDYYLWLNDDTWLVEGAIRRLWETAVTLRAGDEKGIVVGSTMDASGLVSYGGLNQTDRWRPLRFSLVAPDSNEPVECDTMNGNCVLIPASVASAVGNLDPAFVHTMGDFDYGLRARRLGCRIWVAPGFLGRCARNSPAHPSGRVSCFARIREALQPKRFPLRAWLTFTRRHAGLQWPLLFLWPYLKAGWPLLRR